MSVNFNTSRSRFDEWKRFTGVYQRMGQVAVDADWNEEVRLRTVDARRRTGDVADGAPDDGFRICADFVIDPIRSIDGWVATNVSPDDERKPVPELRLDRHDPETLPWVVRSRWHPALRKTLPAPINLTAIPRAASTAFAASALIVELRLERPPADDEIVDIKLVFGDGTTEVAITASTHGLTQSGWCEMRVAAGELAGLDLTRLTTWGVTGLPPVARTWIGALRAVDPALGNDVVIRGGDGTLAGAGRMLIDGYRAFIERDLRFSSQPDFPDPPVLPALPADGSAHHVFYLDVWEQTVTALEDPFLLEPALDGADTAARLRVVTQIRALPLVAKGGAETLPAPTGGGTLTTNIPSGALPDRDPPEPFDPCRDRCLFTENASTGEGYIGSDNLHVRVQVMKVGASNVALWSRDNGSTVMALTAPAAADSTTLQVSHADAARLRTGDLIVIEDRATRLRWDAPNPPVLRRLAGVRAESGILELDPPGSNLTTNPVALPVGGPVGRVFSPGNGASVRRWDGADLLITGVRYRLSDGITFAFAGTSSGWRTGDYWSFTARVNAPDGSATGVVDALTAAPPHGPIHHYAPLARATGSPRVLEDIRKRYLPLVEVRDRLKELGDRRFGPGVFVVVVGDGVRTFGDVDQSTADGLTGDEAIQAALGLLGDKGGSIFIRAGRYQLEHPVLVRSISSVRILGDGDATVLDARGAGGAFYVDRCGATGALSFEDMYLIEDPDAAIDIGPPDPDVDLPSFKVRTLFDKLIETRFSPIAMPAERALDLDDIHVTGGVPDFLSTLGARLLVLQPGEGRVAGSVVATVIALRKLQRLHPGTPLEELPEAQPLLGALSALPHGVVTIADSRQVAVRGCRIEARRPGPNAIGVMVSGTCGAIEIAENRIAAATGIAALPYAPYMANTFLVAFPRAGMALDGLIIAGNDIRAMNASATGIHVADGVLSGTAIDGNLVAGFAVGILIDDQAETGRDAATDRIAVRDNRVVGSTAVGIQVTGDGVDVVGNEIQSAASASPFQCGVQLTGHSARVLDCWIAIPEAPLLSPIALLAGVVVGEGLDDGTTPSRPVFDVEIAGNRIEGAGPETMAIGVVVGGSQPIYDVRVRDNVIRNLGDAALRTWSTSAPIGRLNVEANRIERVALGDLVIAFDNGPILDRLQSGIAATLPPGAANTPRTLLAALVDSALPSVRGPLDAAMRWVERLTLRGAVVMAGVEAGLVNGNRIAEVGRDLPFAAANIDGAEIRTSAIAIVAAAEVVVEGNSIESVRAPYQNLDGGGGGGASTRPEMIDVLAGLGFAPAATRIDRADVHLSASDLRSRTLTYGLAKVDQRPQIAKVMFGPLEALATELQQLAGTAGQLYEPLNREIPPMRTAQSADEHTAAANALRSTLSQAASATAPDDDTKDAWDAAAQYDLATTRDPDAIAAVATRLRQRIDGLTLNLPAVLKAELDTNLKRVIEAPSVLATVLAAAGTLGKVATTRAQLSRKKDLPTATDLVGPAKTVVHTFSAAALKQLDTLATTRTGDNAARLDELRTSKDALVSQLRETNAALANDLSADFLDVDRTNGSVKAAVERLRSTLDRATALAAGTLTDPAVSPDDAARAASQGQAATIHLYAKTLDRQIAGLATESDDSAQKSLGTFKTMVNQLGDLVAAHPDLAPLAKQAATAVQTAAADATQRRVQLGIARGKLDLLRSTLVPALPPPLAADARVVEPIERRLAALGALAIELDSADASSVEPALAAFGSHLDRVLDLVSADAGERERARAGIDDARAGLASGSPAAIRARAIHVLESLVGSAADRALASDTGNVTPQLTAAASLVQAATLAVDPSEDAATRISRVKSYLADRTSRLSSGIVALAQQTVDLPGLTAVLHEGLARIARGVDLVVVDERPPAFIIAPSPADGVFAAGVERRARITGNLITEVVSGIIVTGATGHVMTEPPDDGMSLELATNRIAGATAIAIAARSDGASKVAITDNQAIGCAGIAVATGDAWGHGVLVASGAGDLLVRGNVLSDNGNTTLRALLHEIVVDWRGPVGLRGNAVRHLGGGAGGAGVLVITEPVDGTLITKLAQAPFLGTEPPPRPLQLGRTPAAAATAGLAIRDLAPLSPLARADNKIELGGLRQTVAASPIVQRTLTVPVTAAEHPTVAVAMASRYIDRTRLFVQHPLIDFLRRPPIKFVPPPVVRGYDCVHVEGNDIDAAGPALLLLSNGGTLIAAAVSGNDLRSRGRAGAAYIRRTDSTLFAANRCECLEVTNVVVLRPGKAPTSVTGNVIVGAEPVHQIDNQDTANQAAQAAAAVKPKPGAVHLAVGLGGAKTLNIPVDARALLGTLDRRKNLAADTFSELLADIATTPSGLDEAVQPSGLVRPSGEPLPAEQPARAVFTRADIAPRALKRGTGLSSTMLDLATRQKIAAALPGGTVPNVVGARTLYGHTAGDDDDPVTALKKVVDQVTLHEQHPETAKTQVAALLTASGGDPRKALKMLDQQVLGLDTTKPTIKDSISKVSVVHEVLGDLLSADAADEVTPLGPLAPLAAPLPPPNPADHSLVVIGGTRVAVVGNATTAGVFVQEADAHVELNP
jgi:hypothetical protein